MSRETLVPSSPPMAESPENVTAAPAPPVPAPAPATKPSPPARSGIPPRYDLDAKWDAFLDLSIHRVSYSSHASAFRGLILFLDDKKYKGSIYMDHDLTGLADRPGMRFTMPQIKCYMKQLFTGLHYCHVNQVLHRDIKDSSSTSCSFTVQATSDEDDHRDLHGDEEAPHIVELDGTTVPRSGAAELGQRLRLHGPRPPRWLLARVNKSSQGRDSVTTIYSNSNPWTASTRTKTSDASSSLPRTRYSICASSRNLLCTAKSMRRSAHCSTISLLNWEEERLKIVVVPLLQKLKCEV